MQNGLHIIKHVNIIIMKVRIPNIMKKLYAILFIYILFISLIYILYVCPVFTIKRIFFEFCGNNIFVFYVN